MNGSSNKLAGGADVVLHTPEGDKIECIIRLNFPMTNNEAEYEALVVGSNLAKATEAENMVIYYNSQVISVRLMATTNARTKG